MPQDEDRKPGLVDLIGEMTRGLGEKERNLLGIIALLMENQRRDIVEEVVLAVQSSRIAGKTTELPPNHQEKTWTEWFALVAALRPKEPVRESYRDLLEESYE